MEILCEVSMRHVHLSKKDLGLLFGKSAELEIERPLSQPGQFLSKQRVTLIGPKNAIENVAVLGPTRKETQAEISHTDMFALGLKDVPLRQSGDIDGTPTVSIVVGENKIEGHVIIAKRHVHLDPATAKREDIRDGEMLRVSVNGERSVIFNNVLARVNECYMPAVHLDSDEGNASLAGTTALVFK
jgi:putative phosphotransacetylase